jgi:hypothetical protein
MGGEGRPPRRAQAPRCASCGAWTIIPRYNAYKGVSYCRSKMGLLFLAADWVSKLAAKLRGKAAKKP